MKNRNREALIKQLLIIASAPTIGRPFDGNRTKQQKSTKTASKKARGNFIREK